MILVVDTNIVFNALLNPHSEIGEILIDVGNRFKFCAPEMLKVELEKYQDKIRKYSKLSETEISVIKNIILNSITFISEELISDKNWKEAFNLTKLVDEDDTPFVALAIELNTKLWSGDKKLKGSINNKYKKLITDTNDIIKMIK